MIKNKTSLCAKANKRNVTLKGTLTGTIKNLLHSITKSRESRLKEMRRLYEHRHDPVYSWVPEGEDPPSNDRLGDCQVWINTSDGGMLKEFGIPLRYRSTDNIATWWTKDNRVFKGWVTYWRDF